MFNLRDLSDQIAAVQQGRLSLDDFEDWFRENSRGAYASNDPQIVEVFGSIESLFSEYHFENVPEAAISERLEGVISPFVQPARMYGETVQMFFGNPRFSTSVANPVADVVYRYQPLPGRPLRGLSVSTA